MPRRPVDAALASALALATACGYTSTYTPPDGWRARPIYNGNDIEWIGATELPRCATEVAESATGWQGPPPMLLDDRGYWSPGFHVHVIHVGPPLFPPHGFIPSPPGPHNLFFAALRGGSRGTMSAGGGGNGKGAGMVFALAAAIAVVASSGIAIGLAADPPEDNEVAESIDGINRFNDQARRKIAECYQAAAAPPPAPAPPPALDPAPLVEEAAP